MELLFPLLLVALLVPMFLGVRRQKREAEKVSTMQESLKIGDSVTTTSGLYGTVVDLDDETIDLEIAEDVVTTWLRAAVRDVRTAETTDETGADEAISAKSGTDESGIDDGDEIPAVEESTTQTETRLTKD
ncbi:preprotein translocase subunit YajC [Nocardia noduli]|uniref:preprotein translocase subunit YajC n=1 Tax=Nocardia noduli TaxID=2815722 RepID=UPI001C2204AC|nr:preprotein translocase subunit YajC [Nocardia noduli]